MFPVAMGSVAGGEQSATQPPDRLQFAKMPVPPDDPDDDPDDEPEEEPDDDPEEDPDEDPEDDPEEDPEEDPDDPEDDPDDEPDEDDPLPLPPGELEVVELPHPPSATMAARLGALKRNQRATKGNLRSSRFVRRKRAFSNLTKSRRRPSAREETFPVAAIVLGRTETPTCYTVTVFVSQAHPGAWTLRPIRQRGNHRVRVPRTTT
jgi:hypothetical protein